MGIIADKLKALGKDVTPDQLSAIQWTPKEGEQLIGELVHREVITRKEDGRMYDKVTLRTDEGMVDTIIKSGILALSNPPIARGDIFVITYNGLKSLGDGKRSMHDTTVAVYHTGDTDGAPF